MLILHNAIILNMQDNIFGLPVYVTHSYTTQWHYGSTQLVEEGAIKMGITQANSNK